MNPILGGVYLAWVVCVGRLPGYFRPRVLPLWVIPLVAIAPWTVRNAVVMKGIFPIRDDLGLELYVSYNDCAPYSFRQSMKNGCIGPLHPNSSVEEALTLRAMGEYRYNQMCLKKALAWMRKHPARAASLTAKRAWFFWFPAEDGIQGTGSSVRGCSHYTPRRDASVFLRSISIAAAPNRPSGFFAAVARAVSPHLLLGSVRIPLPISHLLDYLPSRIRGHMARRPRCFGFDEQTQKSCSRCADLNLQIKAQLSRSAPHCRKSPRDLGDAGRAAKPLG